MKLGGDTLPQYLVKRYEDMQSLTE